MEVFDTNVLKTHGLRAANISDRDDFIWQHCAGALQDRLLDIKRGFADIAEIAPQHFVLTPEVRARKNAAHVSFLTPQDIAHEILPYELQALDALISNGYLHWVNDLPGILLQIKRALRPDGLFLAAMIGGETLRELRTSIAQVEMACYGGVSPRVSPFVTLPDMAALMQRAQFALPVVDNEMVTVTYGSLEKMVADLRGMGQTNAVIKRDRKILRKDFWPRVEEFYRQNFADANGRLKATVEIIYLLGWAPDASQPQPLKRGSATHQLVDILKNHEK